MRLLISCAAALCAWAVAERAVAQQASTTGNERVGVATLSRATISDGDIARATPMPLPLVQIQGPQRPSKTPAVPGATGFSPASLGTLGSGEYAAAPVGGYAPTNAPNVSNAITPQAYGTAGMPFTTARAGELGRTTDWPFRAAGKLFIKTGGSIKGCSAALIKRGLVVTAAHCVMEYGSKKVRDSASFVPAYEQGKKPFGVWTVEHVNYMKDWFEGTSGCRANEPCVNDVVVLGLVAQNGGAYPGDKTGWFGYRYDNDRYFVGGSTQVTELGYPGSLDNGERMQRTDSAGTIDEGRKGNTVIGSLQGEGSSGGPWIANFGLPSKITDSSVKPGSDSLDNVIIGVTSTGNKDMKLQTASRFTSDNITALVIEACRYKPDRCK